MNWREELRAIVEHVPRDDVPDLIGELARAQAILTACSSHPPALPASPSGSGKRDRLLDVNEAAQRLSVNVRWLYDHKDLPFRLKLPGGLVRFSERGLERWISTR